jgi:hypothetical protein
MMKELILPPWFDVGMEPGGCHAAWRSTTGVICHPLSFRSNLGVTEERGLYACADYQNDQAASLRGQLVSMKTA